MGLNLEPKPENPAQKKMIAMGVAVAAILALALTLFTHRWLRAGGDIDGGFSLLSMKLCTPDGDCETMSNQALVDEINKDAGELGQDKRSPVFWILGYATFGLIVLSMAALGTAVGLTAKGKFFLGPIAPASTALLLLLVTLVVGCVFVGTNPTKGTAMQFGVGWTFWIFGVGVVTGIVAAQMLNKFKPADPALMY